MTDTANAPERHKMRRMIYENRAHLAPQCVWLAYSEAAEGGDLCLEDEFLSEDDFSNWQHKPPKYVLATHCDELVAAAYVAASEKAWAIAVEMELHAAIGSTTKAKAEAIEGAILSGTPDNARAALTARDERMKAEGAEAADEEAFARGANWAQEKARVEGRLVIVDSSELAILRADLPEAQAKIARLTEVLKAEHAYWVKQADADWAEQDLHERLAEYPIMRKMTEAMRKADALSAALQENANE